MREDYIKRLVETDDPIGEVWSILVELWDTSLPINEYFRQEDKVSEFERELSIIFFEIYDYLYHRVRGSSLRAEAPLIVVDGMSIREGNLLVRDLRDHGYKILEYSYGFSALPSTTDRFREITGFKYLEARSDKILSSIDFKLPIWVPYPDEILHHAAKIIPPHEAYIKTRDLLLGVLGMVDKADVTIVSDHGYLMIDAVWPLAPGDMKFLKKQVFGSSRFVKISDIEQKTLEKLKSIPRDVGYVFLDDEYCYVRGRYFWPIEGYGKVVAHGGLSLMECIVPRIRVRV